MKKKIALLLSVLFVALECLSGTNMTATAAIVDMSKLIRMDELTGWATVAGDGLDGVTGGGDAAPVVVTNLTEFTEVCSDNIPRVIVVSGTIKGGNYGIQIGSNKTIVGIDKNATIVGGIAIHNKSNIIVSNLNINGVWPVGGADDCVEVKNSHHLWFNHLNVWNSWDGNMDITMGSDYVTVSWCKFWYTDDANDGTSPEQDHRLSNLIGSGTGHDDTDMGKLRVTYHHNWFADNLDQRMPRVMYGRVHIYNNYYTCKGNSYCIGADCYATLLVEGNYFKGVKNPHQFSYSNGFPSHIEARNNKYDGTSGKKSTGQGDADGGYAVPFETTIYDYYLSAAEDVPALVEAYAGAQDMSDVNSRPAKLADAAFVAGVEDNIVIPTPEPETEPVVKNDNPITYDAGSDTYTYHGQNSDGTNGFYTIANPFAKKDFSETPTYSGGNPVWTKGATISYWVKVPTGSTDVPTLTFNLKERQMERCDMSKYNQCLEMAYTNPDYSMGDQSVYVDANGREFTVLSGYGEKVCANPNYPLAGCYYATDEGGARRAYKKGTDPEVASNWTYLNYIGGGIYDNYSSRYSEENGKNSLIKEADIKGSLCLYASGTMGYRQDDWTGKDKNPYLPTYGSKLGAHIYNQFYYWGNGSVYSKKNASKTPTMAEKGEWHFVVAVIQNDWIQYYMDGTEMTTDYLNWWGSSINSNTASDSFNLGYGQKKNYKGYTPGIIYQQGKTILDFISDEDTVLTIGGTGYCAENLGQHTVKTDNGAQIKNIQFYYSPVSSNCILADRIDLTKGNTGVEAPDKSTTKHTLTFDAKGGTTTAAITVLEGTPIGKLPVPKKENCIFDGWYINEGLTDELTAKSTISKSIIVFAKWVEVPADEPNPPINPDPPVNPPENPDPPVNPVKKGDVNLDEEIDALDALEILKHVAGMLTTPLTEEQIEAGECIADGRLDAQDALQILKYKAGMIDSLD